jgi:spermidine/putrescine transport system permease protein
MGEFTPGEFARTGRRMIMEKQRNKYSLIKVLRENQAAQGLFLMLPTNIYLLIFIVFPLLLVAVLSFLARGPYGEVAYRFNLANYVRLFDTLYAKILAYSLGVGFGTTLISLLLFLILLPFWTNFIIRIYAWIMILRAEGFLNSFLQWTGIIQQPLNILYTPTAVLIGMVYEFLPFMVLPLYTSLEKIKDAQLEAAADLGAPPWKAFLRVTLPLSVPGMIAGTILVFIPAMGMFVVPDLMGGAKTILVGNLIRNQFLTARDWPFGAAASMILMLLTMAFTLYYTRKAGFGEELLV